MKRFISVLLLIATCMSCVLLSGCGKSKEIDEFVRSGVEYAITTALKQTQGVADFVGATGAGTPELEFTSKQVNGDEFRYEGVFELYYVMETGHKAVITYEFTVTGNIESKTMQFDKLDYETEIIT